MSTSYFSIRKNNLRTYNVLSIAPDSKMRKETKVYFLPWGEFYGPRRLEVPQKIPIQSRVG